MAATTYGFALKLAKLLHVCLCCRNSFWQKLRELFKQICVVLEEGCHLRIDLDVS